MAGSFGDCAAGFSMVPRWQILRPMQLRAVLASKDLDIGMCAPILHHPTDGCGTDVNSRWLALCWPPRPAPAA
jgi:hypothetical protein